MKKSDLLFVGLVFAIIIFIAVLPSPKDNNPPVPGNLAHHGIKVEKDCLACHVQGGQRPMKEKHPKRQDCLRCHRIGM